MITKIGQQFDDSAFTEDPGYMDARNAIYRARRAKDRGYGQFLDDPDLIESSFVKGLIHGVAGGLGTASAAALLSRGNPIATAAGGVLGAGVGTGIGAYKAERDYLRDKGIKIKWHGFGTKMTPEAKARFLGKFDADA